jgi:adenine phosphoribosyltransferase
VTQDIDVKAQIRTVPDFPKPGVLFRDITTLLKQADGFHAVVEKLGAAYRGRPIDKIAAIESRGFIIGAALAYRLNVGFVPIRKQGKLPAENFGYDYHLEYGTDRLELHTDGIQRGEHVLLVDDLIAKPRGGEGIRQLHGTEGRDEGCRRDWGTHRLDYPPHLIEAPRKEHGYDNSGCCARSRRYENVAKRRR